MEFATKIKLVREKMNLSQEGLARALNVSFSTINRWENSKTKPIMMAQAAFNAFCEKNHISFSDMEKIDYDA